MEPTWTQSIPRTSARWVVRDTGRLPGRYARQRASNEMDGFRMGHSKCLLKVITPFDPKLFPFACFTLSRAWIENQLRAAEQGDRFLTNFIGHLGIPHLGCPSAVYNRCDTENDSLTGRA